MPRRSRPPSPSSAHRSPADSRPPALGRTRPPALGRTRRLVLGLVGCVLVAVGLVPAPTPAGVAPPAGAAVAITGAGSTFAQIAIDQWRVDAGREVGVTVNYSGLGSSQGRRQFIAETVDWASSDIPFEDTELPVPRPYTYLPLVAGGTALMYNLRDTAGLQVTNLQLTGPTIARIFTGKIRKWNDPAIKADNPGLAPRLPDEDIKPVVRSGGSGTSAVFTGYVAAVAPDVWGEFASTYGIPGNFTSTFPDVPGFIKQSGSDGIANFVANPNAGRGSIGYAEAGYAKQAGIPMAYVKNASGSWTQPTARAVAIALLDATRNPDGTQNLSRVYFSGHPEAYAISSYNYAIVPTTGFDPAKGAELGKFVIYCITQGQAKAAPLGYSPLPPNLVQQGLDAVRSIPGAPTPPDLGPWGRFYEELAVDAPPRQPPPPQEPAAPGPADPGAGPGAGPTGPTAGPGATGTGPTGPGVGGGTGGGVAAGGTVEGAADPNAAVTEAVADVAAPVGAGLTFDEDGNLIAAGGGTPVELPDPDGSGALLLAGVLLLAFVLGPPAIGLVTGRGRGPAGEHHGGVG